MDFSKEADNYKHFPPNTCQGLLFSNNRITLIKLSSNYWLVTWVECKCKLTDQ